MPADLDLLGWLAGLFRLRAGPFHTAKRYDNLGHLLEHGRTTGSPFQRASLSLKFQGMVRFNTGSVQCRAVALKYGSEMTGFGR